jgi:hypothetical protein
MRKMIMMLVVLALPVATGWTDTDSHDMTVDNVLTEIRDELSLTSDQKIDPDQVPERMLEDLGDAVMSAIHPDEVQHEWMDRMMGGEGSDSLASAHRWMAYRYLTGGYDADGMMGPGMMSGRSSMMGGSMVGGWGMMGNPDYRAMSGPYDSPREVLDRRLAEGEITRPQHKRMLRAIERGPSQ